MRSVRLLPVVIMAATALLLFKGLGLVTNGGYVLTGTETVEAAGGGGHEGGGGAEGESGLPLEPTITDSSPTLKDETLTLPLRSKDAEHENEAAAGAESGHDAEGGGDEAHGDTDLAVAAAPCPPVEQPASAGHSAEAADGEVASEDCVEPAVNADGDSLPTMRDGDGNVVPMTEEAAGSAEAVVERLGARREALDAREAELEMRLALVEAAEKRIEERKVALEELEARINALVEAKKASDDSQFNAIVLMYETMKPKEAAAIFDKLEMPVLVRVAGAVAPRKMAQIMAKMDPLKAKELTAGMAEEQDEAATDAAVEDLAALPQIVGQ